MRRGNADVRSELVRIVGSTSNPGAMEFVIAQLRERGDVKLQERGVASLRRFARNTKALSVLVEVLKDKARHLKVRQAALAVLIDVGKSNQHADGLFLHLAIIMRDRTDPLRREAVKALALVGENQGVPMLLAILRDQTEDAEMRKSALDALANLATGEAVTEIGGILAAGERDISTAANR